MAGEQERTDGPAAPVEKKKAAASRHMLKLEEQYAVTRWLEERRADVVTESDATMAERVSAALAVTVTPAHVQSIRVRILKIEKERLVTVEGEETLPAVAAHVRRLAVEIEDLRRDLAKLHLGRPAAGEHSTPAPVVVPSLPGLTPAA